MMLFLAKSAACVGLVAAVASGVGVDGLATATGRGIRAAVEQAGQSCLQSAPCRHAGVGALTASAAARTAVPALFPPPDAARPAKARPTGG